MVGKRENTCNFISPVLIQIILFNIIIRYNMLNLYYIIYLNINHNYKVPLAREHGEYARAELLAKSCGRGNKSAARFEST